MVLPDHIVQAAKDGDIAVVEAFLDAEPGAINDRDEEWDLTLLMASMNSSITERHVWFARRLIARGADVNIGNIEDKLPLHYACYPGDCSSTMVSLLLASGARVNARTDEDEDLTPLGQLIEEFDYNLWKNEEAENRRRISRSGLEIMKLLLKAGASVDRCQGGLSAEAAMQGFLSRRPPYANDESFIKCRELVLASARTAASRPMCGSRIASFSACALCSYAVAPRRTADASSASRGSRTAPAGTCSRTSGKLRD